MQVIGVLEVEIPVLPGPVGAVRIDGRNLAGPFLLAQTSGSRRTDGPGVGMITGLFGFSRVQFNPVELIAGCSP